MSTRKGPWVKGVAAMAVAAAWAATAYAQMSFDASTTTGGAVRPGFATTCNAAALGALRTNAGALERCEGSTWAVVGASPDRIVSTSANIVAGNGGTISFTTGGTSGTAYLDTVGRLVAPGISTTGPVSGTSVALNTLTINGVAITGNGGVDDTPDAFDFTNVISASTAASVSSNVITLSGLGTVPVMVTTSGTSSTRISVDGGALVRQSVAGIGQTVQAWVSSSAANNSTTVSFITIGSVSDTWAVTTMNATTISVISATYGVNCPSPSPGNRTTRVQTLCNGLMSCSVLVDNTNLTPDPCNGTPKVFSALYNCGGGNKTISNISEGANAVFTCP